MKKTLFSLLALTLLATACSNDDFESQMNTTATEIRINASLDALTRVKTDGLQSTFESEDVIKVYGWTGDATAVPATPPIASENTLTIENNVETWTANPKMLWQSMTADHHFIGIYPSRKVSDFTADAYTLNVSDQTASDLLVAQKTTNATESADDVELVFSHMMAKLCINLHFRDQFETAPTPKEVKLYCGKEATVNYATQDVTAATYIHDDEEFIQMPVLTTPATGYEASYASIVIPQIGVRRVDIDIDGTVYSYIKAPYIPLMSGHITTLNLNLGKDKISLAKTSITPWVENNEYLNFEDNVVNSVTTYTVSTAEELQEVNRKLTDWTGLDEDAIRELMKTNIKLTGDIELPAPTSGGSNWTPIGNEFNSEVFKYNGTFDGNGHTIKGLVINNSEENRQGLIALLGGTVKNLTLEGCTITASQSFGGIAAMNEGTIENCTVKATSGNNVSIIGTNSMGGICGTNCGKIIGCRVLADGGTVTLKGLGGQAGGIASVNANSATIAACLVKGVNVTALNLCGGIVGRNDKHNEELKGILAGCYAYQCTTGETPTAISGDLNIAGVDDHNESGIFNACYYTPKDGTFAGFKGEGHTGSTATGCDATKWCDAVTAMNTALGSIGWKWGGSADSPKLTKEP